MEKELLTKHERKIMERHARIKDAFARKRKEYANAPNYRIYGVVAKEEGVSVPTVRDVVIKAGLVEKRTIRGTD